MIQHGGGKRINTGGLTKAADHARHIAQNGEGILISRDKGGVSGKRLRVIGGAVRGKAIVARGNLEGVLLAPLPDSLLEAAARANHALIDIEALHRVNGLILLGKAHTFVGRPWSGRGNEGALRLTVRQVGRLCANVVVHAHMLQEALVILVMPLAHSHCVH